MPKIYNITLISNASQTTSALLRIPLSSDVFSAILDGANNKLKLAKKKRPARLFLPGGTEVLSNDTDEDVLKKLDGLENKVVVYVSAGEDYVGPPASRGKSSLEGVGGNGATRLIAKEAYVDEAAVEQLRKVAKFEGMELAVGMPDLHPGDRFPIGAAFVSTSHIFPPLIGGDIGCGMALHALPISSTSSSSKPASLASKLSNLEGPYQWPSAEAQNTFWEEFEIPQRDEARDGEWGSGVGTIGSGNHFLEILEWESVEDREVFEGLGLDEGKLVMLVHSGSRGYGQHVLSKFATVSLPAPASPPVTRSSTSAAPTIDPTSSYLALHNTALRWALANRALIARRALGALGGEELAGESRQVLDIFHNNVEEKEVEAEAWERMLGEENNGQKGGEGKKKVWIHRKGAAPSDKGLVVIPGSRGARSYLVMPIGNGEHNAFSLAHGAGRALTRTAAFSRLSKKHAPPSRGGSSRASLNTLYTTVFGSTVVCEDVKTLFEEDPSAYKGIEGVVADLVEVGAAKVVGIMVPRCTYKCRR